MVPPSSHRSCAGGKPISIRRGLGSGIWLFVQWLVLIALGAVPETFQYRVPPVFATKAYARSEWSVPLMTEHHRCPVLSFSQWSQPQEVQALRLLIKHCPNACALICPFNDLCQQGTDADNSQTVAKKCLLLGRYRDGVSRNELFHWQGSQAFRGIGG